MEGMTGSVESAMENVDLLCTPSINSCETMVMLLKDLYDSSTKRGAKSFGPFSALTVEGMDLESLWEQLQTRNRPLLRFIKKKTAVLSRALQAKKRQQRISSVTTHEEEEAYDEQNESDDNSFEIPLEEDDSEDGEGVDAGSAEGGEDADSEEEHQIENEEIEFGDGALAPGTGDFLDEMNAWLDEEEEREEKLQRKRQRGEDSNGHKGASDEYDNNEESEDDETYVARELYEDRGGNEGADVDYRYRDFFGGGRQSKRNDKATEEMERERGEGSNNEADGSDDDYDYGDDDDHDGDEDGDDNDDYDDDDDDADDDADGDDIEDAPKAGKLALTSHQQHKLQLASQIKEIESELIAPKSWDLRGEVKANDRPENSLLGISADIERASKPAPIVTQEYTTTLEDMIRQRIKESNFDDVVPPEATNQPIAAEANDLFLSQERDRTGLGDIYAQEFLSKSHSIVKSDAELTKEEKSKVELKGLFHKICRDLDALSHFHYSPRPVITEASISSSAVPSISLEDITPAAESVGNNSSFAPEEVHEKQRKRSALLADAELTSDDRKRLRRASKSSRRKKLKLTAAQEQAASRQGNASMSYENKKLEETLRADSRVIQSNGEGAQGKSFSKSANFFATLQRQAQQDIRGKRATKEKLTRVTGFEGASVKL